MTHGLAPPWLPRSHRRHIDRALRKLIRLGVCSVCGSPFRHNSRTASGLDAHGSVTVAGECCLDRVVLTFGLGHYSDRQYDFMNAPRRSKSDILPTNAQILDAIAACQKVITATDKRLDGVERRSGVAHTVGVNLHDSPWKNDDRVWFERNPERAHRVRTPFPNEVEAANTPAGHTLLIFVRQVEPGARMRAEVYLDIRLLPLPDDEAAAHALFEVAMGRDVLPPDRRALHALIEKYAADYRRQT
jgi:hypothetical protein